MLEKHSVEENTKKTKQALKTSMYGNYLAISTTQTTLGILLTDSRNTKQLYKNSVRDRYCFTQTTSKLAMEWEESMR